MSIHAVYSLDDLAAVWKVKRTTVYSWIKQERKLGRGPTRYEAIVRMTAGKKALMLREDFARRLQDRYYFRVFRHRVVRSEAERMFWKARHGTR
jgi:hypothetical protein